jgi:hypothetical protein
MAEAWVSSLRTFLLTEEQCIGSLTSSRFRSVKRPVEKNLRFDIVFDMEYATPRTLTLLSSAPILLGAVDSQAGGQDRGQEGGGLQVRRCGRTGASEKPGVSGLPPSRSTIEESEATDRRCMKMQGLSLVFLDSSNGTDRWARTI